MMIQNKCWCGRNMFSCEIAQFSSVMHSMARSLGQMSGQYSFDTIASQTRRPLAIVAQQL
jgi:hypothetical protein